MFLRNCIIALSEPHTYAKYGDLSVCINQSINQSISMDISPKQEVIPIQCIQIDLTLVTDIALYRASINHLKLSIHLSRSLPLGLLPSTTPSYTFFVHRPFSIMSYLPFHSSCLLTSSNTPPLVPAFVRPPRLLLCPSSTLPQFSSIHSSGRLGSSTSVPFWLPMLHTHTSALASLLN